MNDMEESSSPSRDTGPLLAKNNNDNNNANNNVSATAPPAPPASAVGQSASERSRVCRQHDQAVSRVNNNGETNPGGEHYLPWNVFSLLCDEPLPSPKRYVGRNIEITSIRTRLRHMRGPAFRDALASKITIEVEDCMWLFEELLQRCDDREEHLDWRRWECDRRDQEHDRQEQKFARREQEAQRREGEARRREKANLRREADLHQREEELDRQEQAARRTTPTTAGGTASHHQQLNRMQHDTHIAVNEHEENTSHPFAEALDEADVPSLPRQSRQSNHQNGANDGNVPAETSPAFVAEPRGTKRALAQIAIEIVTSAVDVASGAGARSFDQLPPALQKAFEKQLSCYTETEDKFAALTRDVKQKGKTICCFLRHKKLPSRDSDGKFPPENHACADCIKDKVLCIRMLRGYERPRIVPLPESDRNHSAREGDLAFWIKQ